MTVWLRSHSSWLCTGLALFMALELTWHIVEGHMVPIADGEGYAMRGFALYGYLHSGQWGEFFNLLTRPGQSIMPLHYLPFFSLPKPLADTAAYVLLQNLATHLVMAWALVVLADALDRREWAPAVFLLWSVNNIGLIYFYAFFLDQQFSAVATLVVAFQVRAWKTALGRDAVYSGLVLGALFFLKPANALIFFSLYVLSEMIRAAGMRRLFLRAWALRLLGFLPVFFAAIACGALQTILQLIDQNEVNERISPLACTGLVRFLYFPFCLAACYHVLLLGSLLLVAFAMARWLRVGATKQVPAAMHLLVPVAISHVIFGEFFSFWMMVKPVRALLFMLPLLWLFVSWLGERCRLRAGGMLAVAVLYAGIVLAQKEFNVLGTHDHLVEDNYQLTAGSRTEMPSAWHRGETLNQVIGDRIIATLPPAGIVCVNVIETRNALAWRLRNEDLLAGRPPRYEVRNLFDYRGRYFDRALTGANVVALISMFRLQSSRTVWVQTMGMAGYGAEQWGGQGALARQVELPLLGDEAVGTEFIFAQPLSPAQVDAANRAAPLAGARRVPENAATDTVQGRLYSQAEAWSLLREWMKKRFE